MENQGSESVINQGEAVNEVSRAVEKESTLFLVMRHAPTTWNKQNPVDDDIKVQGRINVGIDKEGLSDYFKKIEANQIEEPDVIIVSDLDRTRQTAEGLAEQRKWSKTQIIQDGRFNERSWGDFEGKTHAEIWEKISHDEELMEKYPYLRSKDTRSQMWSDPDFKAYGSQSLNELAEVVKPALVDIKTQSSGKKILVVTSIGVMQALNLDSSKVSPTNIS